MAYWSGKDGRARKQAPLARFTRHRERSYIDARLPRRSPVEAFRTGIHTICLHSLRRGRPIARHAHPSTVNMPSIMTALLRRADPASSAPPMMPPTLPPGAVVPAMPPPPGIVPNFENPDSRGDEIVNVYAVFLSIAFVFIVLRMYTRVAITRAVGLDDCKPPPRPLSPLLSFLSSRSCRMGPSQLD